MKREDILSFITLINQISPFVPPFLMGQLAQHPIAAELAKLTVEKPEEKE